MPIRVKDLVNATRKVQIDFHGETLEVEYWINKATPSLLRAMQGWKDDEALQRGICAMVKRWDLLDENGAEIPVVFEEVDKLPNPLLLVVQKALMDDMRGGEEAKNG